MPKAKPGQNTVETANNSWIYLLRITKDFIPIRQCSGYTPANQVNMENSIKQMTADFLPPGNKIISGESVAVNIEDLTDDESMSQNDTSESDVQMSVVEENPEWKGKSLAQLKEGVAKWGSLSPPVVPSKYHTVLIKLPVKKDKVPLPFPSRQQDKWDQYHVRMPFSSHSLYPITEKNGETSLFPRWELINEAFQHTITNSKQIEKAIFSYNSRHNDKWEFKALHTFFNEVLEEEEVESFFENIFPRVVELALRLPKLVTGPVPLLKKGRAHAVTLSQLQIASLLANAFLCTFPRRNSSKRGAEYASFPDINFNRLFQSAGVNSSSHIMEKFKCIFNYFRRVTSQEPTGVVTFARRVIAPGTFPRWSESTKTLPDLHINSKGTIEVDGEDMLQVDFANKFVGGGVLGWGCVQEEIRFLLSPELLVSRLLTEALDSNEALVVLGAEQYNSYLGYSDSFRWNGNFQDAKDRDHFGRRRTAIVAIDALMFTHSKEQFTSKAICRELNKAYVGFFDPDSSGRSGRLSPVATGNWGCGAFKGDPELKALVQLMATAEADRDLAYFTFHNKQLRDRIYQVHKYLSDTNVTVGQLWQVLCQYCRVLETKGQNRIDLYQYLYQMVDNGIVPSQESSRNSLPRDVSFTEKRPSPLTEPSDVEQSARAGFPLEVLISCVDNICNEQDLANNSNPEPETTDGEINSQEEHSIVDNIPEQEFNQENLNAEPCSSDQSAPLEPVEDNLEDLVECSLPEDLIEASPEAEMEQRFETYSALKKRTGVLNIEQHVVEEVADSEDQVIDQNAKRPKCSKSSAIKRKITDYFNSVQS